MYQKCRLVHGDLSEYNLLYMDGLLIFIDVSQVKGLYPCLGLPYCWCCCGGGDGGMLPAVWTVGVGLSRGRLTVVRQTVSQCKLFVRGPFMENVNVPTSSQ